MKQGKIKLVFILVAVMTLSIFTSYYFTILGSGLITFAGFDFETKVNNHHTTGGSCSGNVQLNNQIVVLSVTTQGSPAGAGCTTSMVTKTQVNSIDEFLLIYDSTISAGSEASGSAGFFLTDRTTYDTRDEQGLWQEYFSFQDEISNNKNQYFDAKVYKLKNNFDGTYSILKSLGVGDVFIVDRTIAVPNKPIYFGFYVSGGAGAYGSSATSTMQVYNVVRKENAFAICKADEYLTTDASGNQICKSLSTIVLNSEEAIKESFDEKLARITAELEAKNTGLTTDINNLKIQLIQSQSTAQTESLQQQITQLQEELKTTKSILADVQAVDKNVISTIEQQEQFKKPNFIKELWNKLISFIKGLFK